MPWWGWLIVAGIAWELVTTITACTRVIETELRTLNSTLRELLQEIESRRP